VLKIWGRTNSINVQKVMWTLAELELPHERVDIGGQFGGLDTAAYGDKNPNRLIPVIEDEGMVLWESNVIVRYLAAKYGTGSLWPEDPAARALSDRWMDWYLSTLIQDMTVVFWGLVRTPPEQRSMTAIETAAERMALTFGILDDHLAGQAYVAGDRLTIGDIPLGAATYRYNALPIKRPALPNVTAWYDRLQEREAFHKHVMIPLT
jgi:glutathione S-transferase